VSSPSRPKARTPLRALALCRARIVRHLDVADPGIGGFTTKIDAGHLDRLVQRVLRIIDAEKMARKSHGADVCTVVAFRPYQVEVPWVGGLLREAPDESMDVPVLPSRDRFPRPSSMGFFSFTMKTNMSRSEA
jgi:hypothetical protein